MKLEAICLFSLTPETFWALRRVPNAQSFFLIERVSNIKSWLLINKIVQTIDNAKQKNILFEEDIIELIDLYDKAIKNKKILATSYDIETLENKLKNLLKNWILQC